MKRFWQMAIRFRLVLAALSIIALVVTVWLRNAPTPVATPTVSSEVPVETAVTLSNTITNSPQETPQAAQEGTPVESGRQSSSQSSAAVSVNPNTTVRDAMAAPTVQSGQVSALETTTPMVSPEQGLLNGTPKEKWSKVGEQF